jgi:hypothetical protein
MVPSPGHRLGRTPGISSAHDKRLYLNDRPKASSLDVKMWRPVVIGVDCDLARGKALNRRHCSTSI